MIAYIKNFLIVISSILLVLGCSEDNSQLIDESNLLVGVWVEPVYENEVLTFKRADELLDDAYGIWFKSQDVLIERTSGWCGTPPIIFHNYDGVWKQEDNLIEIDLEYRLIKWKIITVDKQNLIVEIID